MVIECNLCELSRIRKRIVKPLVVGSGHILFIGDCPTKSDELTGVAYSGPAGSMLRTICADANIENYTALYMVQCYNQEKRDPAPIEILSCMSNIKVNIWQKKIIFLSAIVARFYKKEYPDAITIMNPAAVLRYGGQAIPQYLPMIRKIKTYLMKGIV